MTRPLVPRGAGISAWRSWLRDYRRALGQVGDGPTGDWFATYTDEVSDVLYIDELRPVLLRDVVGRHILDSAEARGA